MTEQIPANKIPNDKSNAIFWLMVSLGWIIIGTYVCIVFGKMALIVGPGGFLP
jgi:hypothetical protein